MQQWSTIQCNTKVSSQSFAVYNRANISIYLNVEPYDRQGAGHFWLRGHDQKILYTGLLNKFKHQNISKPWDWVEDLFKDFPI
jgi:hypothetical protein